MKEFILPEEIRGNKVTLKKNVLEHAQYIFDSVESNRERLREYMYWVDTTKTVDDEIKFIKNSEQHEGKPMRSYGIFYEGRYVGNISVHNVDVDANSCEIGYWIISEAEGKGLVSDAVNALESELANAGFERIVLGIEPSNFRSIRLAERKGYKLEDTVVRNMWGREVKLMLFVKIF